MKKNIFIIFCLQFILAACFSQNTAKNRYILKQKWTLEEVKNMVKKYNLQDSVTMTNNNALMCFDKSEIEFWCQNRLAGIKERTIRERYFRDTEKVKSYADYFRLLDNHPSIKQIIIQGNGGEDGFQKYKARVLKSDWRIYRNEKGELAFRPAKYPISEEEKHLGKRVDTLLKQ